MQSVDQLDEKQNRYIPYLPGETGHRLIYYRDSSVLFPVYKYTFTNPYSKGGEGFAELLYVYFIDLRTLSFYEYPSLSARSKFTRKYIQADSMPVYLGWNFYSFAEQQKADSLKWISDTIINNIKYKRLQYTYEEQYRKLDLSMEARHHIVHLLTSCQNEGSIFHISRYLERRSNAACPFEISLNQVVSPKFTIKVEVRYQRELTKEEHAIFDAWERNLKKYPVRKK